jgi:ABC-type phosphate transport system auxiliary subunit
MDVDSCFLIGLAAVCLTIGLDLGARIMADASTAADPIHESLIALRLRHQDARVKADLAARAVQDAQAARSVLEQHLQEHIEKIKSAFTLTS